MSLGRRPDLPVPQSYLPLLSSTVGPAGETGGATGKGGTSKPPTAPELGQNLGF